LVDLFIDDEIPLPHVYVTLSLSHNTEFQIIFKKSTVATRQSQQQQTTKQPSHEQCLFAPIPKPKKKKTAAATETVAPVQPTPIKTSHGHSHGHSLNRLVRDPRCKVELVARVEQLARKQQRRPARKVPERRGAGVRHEKQHVPIAESGCPSRGCNARKHRENGQKHSRCPNIKYDNKKKKKKKSVVLLLARALIWLASTEPKTLDRQRNKAMRVFLFA
jgi:hypothetical protein